MLSSNLNSKECQSQLLVQTLGGVQESLIDLYLIVKIRSDDEVNYCD